MNEELIRRWNTKVSEEDKVFIIGDFTMGDRSRTKEFASRLHGRKVLVLGNHDKERHCREAFQEIYFFCWNYPNAETPIFLIHDPDQVDASKLVSKPKFVLCGHVHEKWATKIINGIKYYNVGVDAPIFNQDYAPKTLEEILNYG